jgi:acyl-CoA dehydrogenase
LNDAYLRRVLTRVVRLPSDPRDPSSQTSVLVTLVGVQVHRGMGYVEETGAAHHWRDARITTIYEGTTGIQASDLIGLKIARDDGADEKAELREIGVVQGRRLAARDPELAAIAAHLSARVVALRRCVGIIVERYTADLRSAAVGAVPLMEFSASWRAAGKWRVRRSWRTSGLGRS